MTLSCDEGLLTGYVRSNDTHYKVHIDIMKGQLGGRGKTQMMEAGGSSDNSTTNEIGLLRVALGAMVITTALMRASLKSTIFMPDMNQTDCSSERQHHGLRRYR